MKKFIIAKTGEEVKLGDTIRRVRRQKNSFGTIEAVDDVLISIHNINSLIEKGIIKCIDAPKDVNPKNTDIKFDVDSIGFYVKFLSIRYQCSISKVIDWLNATNKICPKAVLDLLLHEIALHFYNADVKGFDEAENYYSLRPRDGKVGKVTNVTSHVPLFKSAEDAERARKILKEQLEYMYGE